MKKSEFIEAINDFWDLDDICSEYELYSMDDVVSDDDLDEILCNEIRERISSITWEDLRDELNDIEDGYSWYLYQGIGDVVGLDEDGFLEYKDDVMCEMEEKGLFDPEDEEIELEEEEKDEEVPAFEVESPQDNNDNDDIVGFSENEPFDLSDLFSSTTEEINARERAKAEEQAKQDEAFYDFYQSGIERSVNYGD